MVQGRHNHTPAIFGCNTIYSAVLIIYRYPTYLGWHIEVLLLKCISHLSEGLKTVDLLSLLKPKPILWLGALLHTHTYTHQFNYCAHLMKLALEH